MELTKESLARLIEQISLDRITQNLGEMVAIPSMNPFGGELGNGVGERAMADYLMQKFGELGLETDSFDVVENRPNVWGKRAGKDGSSVAFIAHMDTVTVENYDDPFNPKVVDGKMYGRGSADMKAAFAAFIEIVHLLNENSIELDGDIYLVGICDEEYLMLGSYAYPEHGPQADFGIVGEPTSLDLATAHRGQLVYSIMAHGVSVHSSQQELGRNAIKATMSVINMLDEFDAQLQIKTPHPLCGHARISPNTISGGEAASIVAGKCELEFDIRHLPGESAHQYTVELQERLDDLEVDGVSFELIGPTWNLPSHEISAETPIVTALADSVEQLTGSRPAPTHITAATDAPNMGFPCIVCGAGDIAQAHTTNEWVELDEVVEAVKMYLGALFNLD